VFWDGEEFEEVLEFEEAMAKPQNPDMPICPECLQYRPDDERVKAGMKCGICAGYGEEASK